MVLNVFNFLLNNFPIKIVTSWNIGHVEWNCRQREETPALVGMRLKGLFITPGSSFKLFTVRFLLVLLIVFNYFWTKKH